MKICEIKNQKYSEIAFLINKHFWHVSLKLKLFSFISGMELHKLLYEYHERQNKAPLPVYDPSSA